MLKMRELPDMSQAAKDALLGTGTNRQGTPIPQLTTQKVRDELTRLEMVGPNLGMTAYGSGIRMQLAILRDEALFN